MSNIERRRSTELMFSGEGYGMNGFVSKLLSHNPLPQTAKYNHREHINITLQYIPGKGYMVAYDDTRVRSNPVMKFAELRYTTIKAKKKSKVETVVTDFRDMVMNSPILSTKKVIKPVVTDIEDNLKLNITTSHQELVQTMVEVCYDAEFLYDKNNRVLGQSQVFIKLN